MKVYQDNKGVVKIRLPEQKNTPSFLLYQYELEILEQVYLHRYMRSADIIDLSVMCRNKNGSSSSRNAVSQRLERLCDSGILKLRQNHAMKNNGFRFNSFFYTVGSRGLEVLEYVGAVTDVEAKRFNDVLSRISLPSNHTMAASTLGNNIYMYLYQNGLMGDNSKIRIMRGSQHPILGTIADVPSEIKGLVVPDYIIETEYAIVALEVDSGRQGKDVILNKVKRYRKFKDSEYGKGKDLYVVFCQIDFSIAKYIENGTRTKRALHLKTIFDSSLYWPTNFYLYSTPASCVPQLVKRIVVELEVIQPIVQSFLTDEWVDYAKVVMKVLGYDIGTFEELELTPSAKKWEQALTADSFITVKQQSKRKRHYIVLRMSPGSVRLYERYKIYLARCKAINESDYFNYTVGIILLFDDHESMNDEVIELEKSRNVDVILTDKQSWVDLASKDRSKIKHSPLPLWEIGTNFSKIKRNE